ncbi:hypothetical protein DSM25558_2831 [Agrobacterium sp. DSM 25558]|uniref:hypothetical protein n=1 Tax=Agrobacterium sp. DSM 25558 TaxID=1907665 RepID=UPI0009724A8C|nr:hypothetical protein [Agrobacterium sp. DSM 25558]SCX21035.1 hypothetical protein DSM25558_2831 [Agrobacterium sp. DSM 25558]
MKIASIIALVAGMAATPSTYANANSDEVLACGGVVEGKTLVVNRSDAKCKWPFDVQKMQIRCNGTALKMGAVYFASEKGAFALNGKAKQTFEDPRPIWLDTDQPGMGKTDVGPWIQVGLQLC